MLSEVLCGSDLPHTVYVSVRLVVGFELEPTTATKASAKDPKRPYSQSFTQILERFLERFL